MRQIPAEGEMMIAWAQVVTVEMQKGNGLKVGGHGGGGQGPGAGCWLVL